MELGTFGAIMKFALEVESDVAQFYEAAREIVKDQKMASLFEKLAIRGQKRVKTVERIRRENITEMILEAITGLNSDTYRPDTSIPDNVDDKKLKEIAGALEKSLQAFYSKAGAKLDFLSEVAYSFELLAEANEEAYQSLS